MIRIGHRARSFSRSSKEPLLAGRRGGSRTSARQASAVARVTAAITPTVGRQPKLSAAQASGRAEAMLPKLPTPIIAPASVPKRAGG